MASGRPLSEVIADGEGVDSFEQASALSLGWRELRRNRLAVGAAVFLLIVVVIAVVAIVWTPYPMYAEDVARPFSGPTLHNPLGVDDLGRDILSRLMVGAQIALEVGIGTQVFVVAIGISLGVVAGYYKGVPDLIISSVINVFYGIPAILVAILIVLFLGNGLQNIIFAIAATSWMDMARQVRGQTLSLREREYVEAARVSGTKPRKIVTRHILPNALGPIVVQATYGIPSAILFEAFMSFLGLGVEPPTPSWGAMASDGFQSIRLAPHIVLAPAIALSLTLMAFNFLGDGVRDALDPRGRRR